MGLYNFKPQFEADIMADRKRHTIRAKRRYPDKPGNLLHLYVGLRTKKSKLLKRRRCTRVQDLTIEFRQAGAVLRMLIFIDNAGPLASHEADLFARSDGFPSLYEMADFWIKHHGTEKPFHGDLIHWESDAESEGGQKHTSAVLKQMIGGFYGARKPRAPRKKRVAKQ